jgi:outer membrane protein assembly factor BamB
MRSIFRKLFILFVVFIIAGCKRYYAPGWYTDRHDLTHKASVNDANVSVPLSLRWVISLPMPIVGSAIGAGGSVVIGAGDTLFALSPQNGKINWRYATDAPITTSATFFSFNKGAVNRVAVVDGKGNLHCINSDNGAGVWRLNDGLGSFNSAPNQAVETIYYTKMKTGVSSSLKAVRVQDGSLIWERPYNITCSTPLQGFGSIFYGGDEQSSRPYKCYSEANGDLVWEYLSGTTAPDLNTPITYTNGVVDSEVELNTPARVYFGLGSSPATVKALAINTGRELWKLDLPGYGAITSFALTSQRTEKVLIVTQRNKIYRLNPDNGSIVWEKEVLSNTAFSYNKKTPQALIWGDYIFSIEDNRVLKAYSISDGQEAWSYQLEGKVYGSPIAGGKTLYIGTSTGKFYAFSYPKRN